MIKLIIPKRGKKKPKHNKISVCLAKVLDLFLWHPFLVLVLGILGFVGKGAAPVVGQLGRGERGGDFFPCFPWS
jgi:hypothetical protein